MSNYYSSTKEEYGFQGPFETEYDAIEECIEGYNMGEDPEERIYLGIGKIPQFKFDKHDALGILEAWADNSDFYEDFYDDFFRPIKDEDLLALKDHMEKAMVNWVNERRINIPETIDVYKYITFGDWQRERPDVQDNK